MPKQPRAQLASILSIIASLSNPATASAISRDLAASIFLRIPFPECRIKTRQLARVRTLAMANDPRLIEPAIGGRHEIK
jgi:hypothetical protein